MHCAVWGIIPNVSNLGELPPLRGQLSTRTTPGGKEVHQPDLPCLPVLHQPFKHLWGQAEHWGVEGVLPNQHSALSTLCMYPASHTEHWGLRVSCQINTIHSVHVHVSCQSH